MKDYVAFSCIGLEPGTTFVHPPELPELVRLDSPAVEVMTDFQYVRPVTTTPEVPVDEALEKMKSAGVRLLLVTGPDNKVLGTVTSKILLGEEPIKIVQEKRIPRSAITVEMLMTPQNEVTVLNIVSVRNAKVGHIVETLTKLNRKHLLVVETDEGTKVQRIRGLFSTSQIGRQLGVTVVPEMPAAQTLAEIQQQLG